MNVLYGDLTSACTINDLIERIEALEKFKQDTIQQFVKDVSANAEEITVIVQHDDGTTETKTYPIAE